MAQIAVMDNIREDSPPAENPADMAGVNLVEMASAELERLRGASRQKNHRFHSFPPACLAMLRSLKGNQRCVDCGDHNPEWAAVSYGALVCLQCSGHHRSLGVQWSCVRSISMDDWSVKEVLSLLEGGNAQLSTFFERHALSQKSNLKSSVITKENVTRLRYKTKAAQFYRQQMEVHVTKVLDSGPYRGREMSRAQRPSLGRRNTTVE